MRFAHGDDQRLALEDGAEGVGRRVEEAAPELDAVVAGGAAAEGAGAGTAIAVEAAGGEGAAGRAGAPPG